MTDLLLLIIIGNLFNMGNLYWTLILICTIIEFAKVMCILFKAVKK